MNVLVTGATGFVGRYLVKQLIEQGHFCRCLSRSGDFDDLFRQPKVETVTADITAPETLAGICRGMDAVFHLAGAGHVAAV